MTPDMEDAVLSWIGLAIAVVVLNDFGLGKLARYTLLAVILYDVLTNVERISGLVTRWQAGLAPARTSSSSWGHGSDPGQSQQR